MKSYAGTGNESFMTTANTPDGGYITGGYTSSSDGDFTKNEGGSDFLIAKFDGQGNKEWIKSYGGSKSDYFYGIRPTVGGGYIAAGFSSSNDKDIPGNNGYEDMILAKFDSNGNKQWIKNYGGTASDFLYDVVEIPGGDYIAVGLTASSNGDITALKGSYDAVMVRVDKNGNKIWVKNIGGSKQEDFNTVNLTKDGNLILSAESSSINGDLIGGRGYADMVIAKYDFNGNQLWHKSFGGSKNDYLSSVIETSDGSFVGVGYSESTNGDMTGLNKGVIDATIIKVDSNGNKLWMKSFGGTGSDAFYSILESPDGGYVASGFTNSPSNSEVPEINGVSDGIVVKYDPYGNIMWKKAVGGIGGDNIMDGVLTNTGDYLFTGTTYGQDYSLMGADAAVYRIEGDHTPPSEISNLGEVHNYNSVTLNWFNPTDKYFDHVNVYRDGVLVHSVTSNFFYEIGLNDGADYDYRISTVDKFGNESLGTMLHIKTVDITPPAVPADSEAVGKDGVIHISWAANTEPDFLGYNVYVNGIKQNSIPTQNNQYQVTGLDSGKTYQISITAVDTANNESPSSDVINAYVFDTIAPNRPALRVLSYNAPERKVTLEIENRDPDVYGTNLYINGIVYNSSLIQEQTVTLDLLPGVYRFSATSLDQFFNESEISQPIELVVDGTPPEIPTNIRANGENRTIKINWDSNIEADLEGYNVYLNGVKQNSSPVKGNYYEISGVADGKTYQVSVSSIDTSANESAQSNLIDVLVKDTIAPNPPSVAIPNYNPETQQLNIKLMANDMDTKGFNLYVNDTKSNVVLIREQDSSINLAPGIYRIAATAVDEFGNESISSPVITYTVENKKTDTPQLYAPKYVDNIIESIKNRENQITGKALDIINPVQANPNEPKEDLTIPAESPKKIRYAIEEQLKSSGDNNSAVKEEPSSGTKVSISTPKNLETKTTNNRRPLPSAEKGDLDTINSNVGASPSSIYVKKNITDPLNDESKISINNKKEREGSPTPETESHKNSKWILWSSIGISVLSLGAISFLLTKILKIKL
ncbi:hypothetical protein WKH56_08820 [Priestia sp. SB1]|uniref:fibronectin type III domain-containing protein n=1 Tax=Priestia sp. SB1 TaxID=3132359 RepID=UPI0031775AC8